MLLSLIFKRAFSLAAKKKWRVNLPAPKAKRREFKWPRALGSEYFAWSDGDGSSRNLTVPNCLPPPKRQPLRILDSPLSPEAPLEGGRPQTQARIVSPTRQGTGSRITHPRIPPPRLAHTRAFNSWLSSSTLVPLLLSRKFPASPLPGAGG